MNKEVLKKVGIGFGIFFGFIFLVLLITPLLFKGKIMEIAKTEINKMLTAEVNFSDLKLSFIRNFPNAYVALEDLSVVGTGDFEGETLVAFKRFSVTVDIVSVIGMKNIKVKSILLDKAEINGHILEDGRANWDIMKASEAPEGAQIPEAKEEVAEVTPAEPAEAAEMPFNVALKKFEIRKAKLSFKDESSKMEAGVDELNFTLRGDMAKEIVDLKLKLGITGINFWMDGVRLLNNAFVGFDSQVGADLKNMAFTVKDNKFNLNEIVLNFSGAAKLGDDIDLDLEFATDKTEFKSLLSLVPAIYMQDFKSLETAGSLTLSGFVKGTMNDEQMPSGSVSLTVDNAMFKYPALPKSVTDINIDIKAFYDGVVLDNTTLDINKFELKLGGNPFSFNLHVKTPESDLDVAAKFAGRIDFSSIQDLVPMPDTTLKGLLECDIELAGKMSTLESERYEDFKADGLLKVTGVNFVTPDFPQAINLSILQLNFNPRRVELALTDATVGSTDLSLNGNLENFIPFVFNRGTVRGNLDLKSKNINLNEFMSGEPKEEVEKTEEAAPLSVVEVPKNIDFRMNANIGKILFDKLSITDTVGIIIVRDGKVEMQRLGMNLLDGSMVLNGEYNTQNVKVPTVNMGMDIKQFNIPTAIASITTLETILPNPENYSGRVSANLNLFSILGEDMSPVLDSINSKGRLQTQDLQLKNSPLFGTLATLTRNESYRNPSLGNVDVGFEIKDGRLFIEPINMKMGSTSIVIAGDQGLDSSLNYTVTAGVPVASLGAGADLLGKIPGGSAIKELPITGQITGTPSDPKVSLAAADMTSSVAGAVVDSAKAAVSAEVQKQIDSIMAEAQKQADNIKSTAKTSADKLRSEANAQANNLEAQAANKSVIEKRAAKAAADKIRSEGEANARRVEQEAARQADNVLAAARQRADALR